MLLSVSTRKSDRLTVESIVERMNKLVGILLLGIVCASCSNPEESKEEQVVYENKGHELVAKMSEKVGEYQLLRDKHDVIYTYRYETPDGKADVSTEKYLFKGELSYGFYRQHERTFPDLEGAIEMAYDGNEYWLKNDGKILEDSAMLASVRFKRPTNFYWFAMFQKLLSPGVNYAYLGETKAKGNDYEIVKITYDSKDDRPTDIYQLYINKKTMLVDYFLFTVADYDVIEVPFLMELEYEKIDGFLIPTKRRYKKSTWEAEVTDEPWILVNWMDIKFNNGLTQEDFAK